MDRIAPHAMTVEAELDVLLSFLAAPAARRDPRQVNFRKSLSGVHSDGLELRCLRGNRVHREQALERRFGIGEEHVEGQSARAAIADREVLLERLVAVQRRFHRGDAELDGSGVRSPRRLHSGAFPIVVPRHEPVSIGQPIGHRFVGVLVDE